MEDIARNLLQKYKAPGRFDLGTFIVITMRAVEEFAARQKDGSMKGADKLKMAMSWIDIMIIEAVKEQMIGPEQGNDLLATTAALGPALESVINAYVVISKNPTFLQIKKHMTGCCFKKRANPTV
jgi:hypothetical protein